MLTVAVCDDEEAFRDGLCTRLEPVLAELGEAYRLERFAGPELLEASGLIFDVLFLDIQMPGAGGLEAARQLRKDGKIREVVFVTAFPEYVFDVFELEAVDYLCKPVDGARLKRALRRAAARSRTGQEKALLIQTSGLCRRVKLADILYCEVIDRKIYLHTAEDLIEYYGRMEELERQVDGRFYRCHRSYLVNLDRLASFTGEESSLEGGERVPVSRLRRRAFLEAMMRRLRGRGEV